MHISIEDSPVYCVSIPADKFTRQRCRQILARKMGTKLTQLSTREEEMLVRLDLWLERAGRYMENAAGKQPVAFMYTNTSTDQSVVFVGREGYDSFQVQVLP